MSKSSDKKDRNLSDAWYDAAIKAYENPKKGESRRIKGSERKTLYDELNKAVCVLRAMKGDGIKITEDIVREFLEGQYKKGNDFRSALKRAFQFDPELKDMLSRIKPLVDAPDAPRC